MELLRNSQKQKRFEKSKSQSKSEKCTSVQLKDSYLLDNELSHYQSQRLLDSLLDGDFHTNEANSVKMSEHMT